MADDVIQLDWGVNPDVGAPFPILLSSEFRFSVVYFAHSPRGDKGFAVVRGEMLLLRFGFPADETRWANSLMTRGLRHYACQEILQSSWVQEMEGLEMRETGSPYSSFASARHIVITFHDTTLEVLAGEGIEAIMTSDPISEIVEMESRRLIGEYNSH
jgi:hypothetical protein